MARTSWSSPARPAFLGQYVLVLSFLTLENDDIAVDERHSLEKVENLEGGIDSCY